ncbi:MAG: hypothetical protein RIM84_15695 [Alphaproteobacteria bacterium]
MVAIVSIGAVVLAVPVLFGGEPVSAANLRIVVLSKMRERLNLGNTAILDWAPVIGADSYGVGSVFLPDERFLRESEACTGVPKVESLSNGVWSFSQTVEVSPEAIYTPILEEGPIKAEIEASFEYASAVQYKLETSSATMIESRLAMVRHVTSSAECLADVANREVVMLVGRVVGTERYDFEESIAGKFRSLFTSIGFGGNSIKAAKNRFADSDARPVFWVLTPLKLPEPRVNGPNEALRREQAADVLAAETTEYALKVEPTIQTDLHSPIIAMELAPRTSR